jgi:hypothetical protein
MIVVKNKVNANDAEHSRTIVLLLRTTLKHISICCISDLSYFPALSFEAKPPSFKDRYPALVLPDRRVPIGLNLIVFLFGFPATILSFSDNRQLMQTLLQVLKGC